MGKMTSSDFIDALRVQLRDLRRAAAAGGAIQIPAVEAGARFLSYFVGADDPDVMDADAEVHAAGVTTSPRFIRRRAAGAAPAGISFDSAIKRWRVRVQVGASRKSLGSYATVEEASAAKAQYEADPAAWPMRGRGGSKPGPRACSPTGRPSKLEAVLDLFATTDLTRGEIAAQLSLAEHTVRGYLSRGTKRGSERVAKGRARREGQASPPLACVPEAERMVPRWPVPESPASWVSLNTYGPLRINPNNGIIVGPKGTWRTGRATAYALVKLARIPAGSFLPLSRMRTGVSLGDDDSLRRVLPTWRVELARIGVALKSGIMPDDFYLETMAEDVAA